MDPAAPRLRRGAKVIVAISGGTQARQRLKCLRYALVNTDLRLSDGNGLEIMDRPADFGARTSILSGYAFQLPPKAADRKGADKPMRPGESAVAVQRLIGPAC